MYLPSTKLKKIYIALRKLNKVSKSKKKCSNTLTENPPTTGVGEDVGKKVPSYTAGGNAN
jgi:hypothetical protein